MLMHPHHHGIIRIVLAIAVLLLFAGICLASGKVVDTIERSFSISGRPTLVSRNVDGQTRITAGSVPTIQVKAVKEVIRATNDDEGRKAAEKIEVRIEQIGNRVEVEVRQPREVFSLWWNVRVRVYLDIVAPAASDLDVSSVDGAVVVEGFKGRLDISTVDGSLTAHACSGQLKARTVDGALQIDGGQGEIDTQTTDGAQSIEGEFESVATHSTDGSIEVRALSGSRMTRDWSIRTTDGSIRLHLPEGFSANLEAVAGDGRISSDHPVTVNGTTSEHKLFGKMNSGGNTLHLQSSARLEAPWDELQPWDDAPALLLDLAPSYRLGIVTNCSERLGRRATARLQAPFECVVTAERAGKYKPDPAPYRLALRELGLPAERVLFIAGSAFDLFGTARVGLDTLWHNRIGLAAPDGAPAPVLQARTLRPMVDNFLALQRNLS